MWSPFYFAVFFFLWSPFYFSVFFLKKVEAPGAQKRKEKTQHKETGKKAKNGDHEGKERKRF
jgi:hypothetical protein